MYTGIVQVIDWDLFTLVLPLLVLAERSPCELSRVAGFFVRGDLLACFSYGLVWGLLFCLCTMYS